MKIATRKPHARTPRRDVRAVKPPSVQDHDLPILALEESSAPQLDWDELIEGGVQPALLIGGERRWQGRR